MQIQTMTQEECMKLIVAERLGRLACCKEGRPFIVPIYYVCSGGLIYCFSMPGQKLDFMRSNPNVCFEIEAIEERRQWKCVIIQGLFSEFLTPEERQAAWDILKVYNDWWEVGSQPMGEASRAGEQLPVYFSVSMDSVTGRSAVPD